MPAEVWQAAGKGDIMGIRADRVWPQVEKGGKVQSRGA